MIGSPWLAEPPPGWRLVPLRSLFRRRKILGFVDEPMVSVFRDHGVVFKDSRENLNKTAEDRSIYQLVDDGWLVVNRMKAWQGSVGVSEIRGIVSGHYICFQPTHREDSRYLNHLLRSPVYTTMFGALSRGVRNGQIEIDNDDLGSLSVLLPPLEEQRRIADFLDDQTTRIDQIITARELQVAHLQSVFDATWDTDARKLAGEYGQVPLRRFLRSITDGPFGSALTSSHYSDEGVRVVRLGNIGLDHFRNSDAAFIPVSYASQLSQHAVEPGDLLMAGLGDERWPLGRCAVAPAYLGPAIVKADCYRIRLDDRLATDFAAWYLSSPMSRTQFSELARGSTRLRLNTQLAREALIAPAHAEVQKRAVDAHRDFRAHHSLAKANLERSIGLLGEFKRSLVSAAVAGEFDMSTASGRGVLV